jgi:hypothetical protein
MNKEYIDIEYKGTNFKIEKEISESYDLFYNRAWYIVKNNPQNEEELNDLKPKSIIWVNKNFLRMKYEDINL